MIDDRLQIDGFNPYVWSGTFGVPKDGFPKTWFIDGSYTTQIDETPMTVTEPIQGADDPGRNFSGSMYLKTAETSPAPFLGYPARKLEYSDGTVSWFRPGAKWPWIGLGGESDGYTAKLQGGVRRSCSGWHCWHWSPSFSLDCGDLRGDDLH